MTEQRRMTVIPGDLDTSPVSTAAPRRPRTTEEIVATWTNLENGLQFTLPVDITALWSTAGLVAQFEQMTFYLDEVDPVSKRRRGPLNGHGVPRPCMKIYASTYTAAMNGLRSLGATPASRAAMMSGVAAGMGVAGQLANHRRSKDRP